MIPAMIKMKHSAKVNALIVEHTNGALNVPMDFILDVKFGRETVSLFILDQGAVTLAVTDRQKMHMRLFVALHNNYMMSRKSYRGQFDVAVKSEDFGGVM